MIKFKQIIVVILMGIISLSTGIVVVKSFEHAPNPQITSTVFSEPAGKADPIMGPLKELAPTNIIEESKNVASSVKTTATKKVAPKPKIAGATVSTQKSSGCSGSMPEQFLCLLNQYRVSNGKGKLVSNSGLSNVALGHSTWMSNTGTFSHVGKDGGRLTERCAAAKIPCRAENLAHNISSAQQLLDMWKISPSHNANLLGPYTTLGYGAYGGYISILFN